MLKKLNESETVSKNLNSIVLLLGVLPAIPSFIIGIVGIIKGEPFAEKSWITLRDNFNKQSEVVNQLVRKVEANEKYMEGLQTGKLQSEIESLKKQLEETRFERLGRLISKEASKSLHDAFYVGAGVKGGGGLGIAATEPDKCKPGFTDDGKGKCITIPKSIGEKLKKQTEETAALKAEKLKMQKAQQEMQKRLQLQQKNNSMPHLQQLPDTPKE